MVGHRGESRHFHKGKAGVGFFLGGGGGGGYSDFKTIVLRKSKDTEAYFKTKISKQGKKKNDKDEIENILSKHLFTSL